MERLTRPTVEVDETAAQYMGNVIDLRTVNDKLLGLILNGPTLNAVNKDVLRHMIRQLYARLAAYEDTGLSPKICAEHKKFENEAVGKGVPFSRIIELMEADEDGRLVVLPCKVGETAWVKDRAGVPREMRLCSPDIRFVCTDEDNLCMALCNRKPDGFCAYRLRNDGSDIGKTVFRTCEDAENVLNPCDRCMSGSYRGCDGCGYAEKTPEGGEAGDY